jgi:hypothetical protein
MGAKRGSIFKNSGVCQVSDLSVSGPGLIEPGC